MHELILSVVIPAYNEENNLRATLNDLQVALREEKVPYEIIVVNDNSTDDTEEVLESCVSGDPGIRLVNRKPPGGFGRAVRSGLEQVRGDVVAIYMADSSDEPNDLIRCYRKIEEGYDCVFGTRFSKHSKVNGYPRKKLIINRIVNRSIQLLFWTKHNDLTNAFKVYRTHVVRECGPYNSSHFNITIEMSLSALIRGYTIAAIPINWEGRTWGTSNLRVGEMGRRYLSVLLKLFFERILIADDLKAERMARQLVENTRASDWDERISAIEERIETLEQK